MCLALAIAAEPALGLGKDWVLVPERSEIIFHAEVEEPNGDAMARIQGEFEQFTATLYYPAFWAEFGAADAALRMELRLDMTSLTTGKAGFDQQMKGPDWFDVAAYPEARVTVAGIDCLGLLGGRACGAEGQLSLRGVTQAVPIHFSFDRRDRQELCIEGRATIPRTEFGIGARVGPGTATAEVPVGFKLCAQPAPEPKP